jgi:hypothetical protein
MMGCSCAILMLAAAALAESPEAAKSQPKPETSPAAAAQIPTALTGAAKLKLREMERDYWQIIAKMREYERDYENLRLRSVGLQREITAQYEVMRASCSPGQELDTDKLACATKPPAKKQASESAPGGTSDIQRRVQ